MKTVKKIIVIILAIGLCVFIAFKLISNKKQKDTELKAMLEYNEVVPVEVITVKYKNIEKEIVENGVFHSNSDVEILSETQGKVLTVAHQIGDRISKGQILATIEKEVLESQFLLAKENLSKAEKDLGRYKNLAGGEAITQQQFEDARLNYQNAQTEFITVKKHLDNTTLKAPVSGTVSERLVKKGTFLVPAMHTFTISDQSRMIFKMKVSEANIPDITEGQETTISADALPDKLFRGKVKNIGVITDLSGRYMVEVEISNANYLLRSGMTGNATLIFPSKKSRLVIPRKCIDGSLRDAHVYVLKDKTVSRQAIIVKPIDSEWINIVSGLQPGEKIVVSGLINLKDGSEVNVINANLKTE